MNYFEPPILRSSCWNEACDTSIPFRQKQRVFLRMQEPRVGGRLLALGSCFSRSTTLPGDVLYGQAPLQPVSRNARRQGHPSSTQTRPQPIIFIAPASDIAFLAFCL
jgi:hypothetical protein